MQSSWWVGWVGSFRFPPSMQFVIPGCRVEPPLRACGIMVHLTYAALHEGEITFQSLLTAARGWAAAEQPHDPSASHSLSPAKEPVPPRATMPPKRGRTARIPVPTGYRVQYTLCSTHLPFPQHTHTRAHDQHSTLAMLVGTLAGTCPCLQGVRSSFPGRPAGQPAGAPRRGQSLCTHHPSSRTTVPRRSATALPRENMGDGRVLLLLPTYSMRWRPCAGACSPMRAQIDPKLAAPAQVMDPVCTRARAAHTAWLVRPPPMPS